MLNDSCFKVQALEREVALLKEKASKGGSKHGMGKWRVPLGGQAAADHANPAGSTQIQKQAEALEDANTIREQYEIKARGLESIIHSLEKGLQQEKDKNKALEVELQTVRHSDTGPLDQNSDYFDGELSQLALEI